MATKEGYIINVTQYIPIGQHWVSRNLGTHLGQRMASFKTRDSE